ncbi:hypothetical protein HELRODRAFT_169836 [Helobdella robusta]|uniref:C2H2-type domain-containing protein n=1 Tax=Helobdella robusta TaxID=6412 RepID=T1F2D0_HELRO|nr:hypothetical protein HELRODRAFT_169836 [Helobdella robusta]ESO08103.1 hypothetical protein HELRODRAFT_169836 [Helobdella robusta]
MTSSYQWDLNKHIRTSSHPHAHLIELPEHVAKATFHEVLKKDSGYDIDSYFNNEQQQYESANNFKPDITATNTTSPSLLSSVKYKPFMCGTCGYRCNWKCDINRHIKSVHGTSTIRFLTETVARETFPDYEKQYRNQPWKMQQGGNLQPNQHETVSSGNGSSTPGCLYLSDSGSNADGSILMTYDGDSGMASFTTSHTVDAKKTKKFKCSSCPYRSNFRSDVGRHIRHKHDRAQCKIVVMSDEEAASTLDEYMITWARKKFIPIPNKRRFVILNDGSVSEQCTMTACQPTLQPIIVSSTTSLSADEKTDGRMDEKMDERMNEDAESCSSLNSSLDAKSDINNNIAAAAAATTATTTVDTNNSGNNSNNSNNNISINNNNNYNNNNIQNNNNGKSYRPWWKCSRCDMRNLCKEVIVQHWKAAHGNNNNKNNTNSNINNNYNNIHNNNSNNNNVNINPNDFSYDFISPAKKPRLDIMSSNTLTTGTTAAAATTTTATTTNNSYNNNYNIYTTTTTTTDEMNTNSKSAQIANTIHKGNNSLFSSTATTTNNTTNTTTTITTTTNASTATTTTTTTTTTNNNNKTRADLIIKDGKIIKMDVDEDDDDDDGYDDDDDDDTMNLLNDDELYNNNNNNDNNGNMNDKNKNCDDFKKRFMESLHLMQVANP